MPVSLLSSRQEVEGYLDQVRQAADTEKDAFGFLPRSAYAEFAYQGRMVIAINSASKDLLGYVLYGGAMPQGRVFQTWTHPSGRGKGVGRLLINEVVSRLETQSYLSIKADVADDLEQANRFYGRLGFDVIRTRPGRTPGRTINVRVRELATPSLLEMAISEDELGTCLPVEIAATSKAPLYVIDLNVLFDVTKQRARATSARKVMTAAFENDVRLAVSEELASELERHCSDGTPDPTLALARSIPRLPVPGGERRNQLMSSLAPLIFPERARENRLKVQDSSDLLHLATAIEECAVGFITSEKAVLKAAKALIEQYGLDVLSPDAFGITFEVGADQSSALTVSSQQSRISASLFQDGDRSQVEQFLKDRHVSQQDSRSFLAAGTATLPRRRHIVRVDGEVVGFACWDAPQAGARCRDFVVYVDESSHAAASSSEYLIRRAICDVGPFAPAMYRLAIPRAQSTIRRGSIANGFFPDEGRSPRAQPLQKVAAGRILGPANWSAFCRAMRDCSGMALVGNVPTFVGLSQPIEIKDRESRPMTVTLAEFERLLSPVVTVLPGRPAVVLPITQSFAEDLFRGSAQRSFLSEQEAVLRTMRGYIAAAATYSIVPEGGLAVFYESGTGGGRKAATAVARITRRYLMAKESAATFVTQRGVIDPQSLGEIGPGKQIAVTEFEDLMLFGTPVPLARLREIGCVPRSNFVTASRLAHEHLIAILAEGDPHAV